MSGDRYLGDGHIDRRESLYADLSPGEVFSPFCGDIFRVPIKGSKRAFGGPFLGLSGTVFCHLTMNISKMVSRRITCH